MVSQCRENMNSLNSTSVFTQSLKMSQAFAVSKENIPLQMQWGTMPVWQEVLTCTKKHGLGWLKGEMEFCWREFSPDLKCNCRSKKMGGKLQILWKSFKLYSTWKFLLLWSWKNSASFLLAVSLYFFFSFSGQIKVNRSSDSKNPGLLNQ